MLAALIHTCKQRGMPKDLWHKLQLHNAELSENLALKAKTFMQRYRKEKLCGFFAPLRLCVRLFLFEVGSFGLRSENIVWNALSPFIPHHQRQQNRHGHAGQARYSPAEMAE